MAKEKVPTEETVQQTLDVAELSKVQIKERLEVLEKTQRQILETLSRHGKKIDQCSIRR